jgi:hypothetical protein
MVRVRADEVIYVVEKYENYAFGETHNKKVDQRFYYMLQ